MVHRDIKNGVGMAVHAVRSATASASASASASAMAWHYQDADAEGCTVIWSNLVYLALNNLFMVYRDIKNGVGMAVHAMRLATASASASASALVTAQDNQDADAEGCTVIWSNLVYLALNNLLMVYRDMKMEWALQCMP